MKNTQRHPETIQEIQQHYFKMSLVLKDEKWASSQACVQLRQDLIDGAIDPRNYTPKSVWLSREIYQTFELGKFRSNAGKAIKKFMTGKYNKIFNLYLHLIIKIY